MTYAFSPSRKVFGSNHSHSYNKKKKLKMDEFSWLHQKTEVVGQIPTMNFGETGLLLRTETAGDINCYFKG